MWFEICAELVCVLRKTCAARGLVVTTCCVNVRCQMPFGHDVLCEYVRCSAAGGPGFKRFICVAQRAGGMESRACQTFLTAPCGSIGCILCADPLLAVVPASVCTDEAESAVVPPGKFMRKSWVTLVRRGGREGRGIKEACKQWTHHHRAAQTERSMLDLAPVSVHVPPALDTLVLGHIVRVLRLVPIHPSAFPAVRLKINLLLAKCRPLALEPWIYPLRLPLDVWRLLVAFGACERSFCHLIVPHFPDTGGVFMCLVRERQGRQQPGRVST